MGAPQAPTNGRGRGERDTQDGGGGGGGGEGLSVWKPGTAARARVFPTFIPLRQLKPVIFLFN